MAIRLQGSAPRVDKHGDRQYGVHWETQWEGEGVQRRVLQAVRQGLDEVAGRCVNDAKREVPWWTGRLSKSLKIVDKGHEKDKLWVDWGSELWYAFYVETRDPTIDTRQGNVPEPTGLPQNTGRRYTLRRMADRHYPKLPGVIEGKLP